MTTSLKSIDSALNMTVLCGGFGAARFLSPTTDPSLNLTCVANVGDDHDYLGLRVCPDLDSVLYALAGRFDEDRGWGVTSETFATNEELARYGDDWFHLGDRDLALSLKRTSLLRIGMSLSSATEALACSWALPARLLPATDDDVRTMVETESGWVTLQEFLVREHARPVVYSVAYAGAADAKAAPHVVSSIESADVVVLAPSNPVTSIGPMLAVDDIQRALVDREGPTVAVTPVVLGTPPATNATRHRAVAREKLLRARGLAHRPSAVAQQYVKLIDCFVLDERDSDEASVIEGYGIAVTLADTLSTTCQARQALLTTVADLGRSVRPRRRGPS